MIAACPSEQEVDDFLSRRLTPAAAAAVTDHLDGCAACRRLVSALAPDWIDASAATARDDGDLAIELTAGARIGRFVLGERIGTGAMGAVHAAHDPRLDRQVALKLLLDAHDDAPGRARLIREAQSLARLAHPNVVAVHEVGEHHGRVFVAMELVVGVTLTQWLRGRARTWPTLRDVFVQAGRGLAAAHAAGFVHRDIKPDNLLVGDDGRARVTDFGLARRDHDPDDGPAADAPIDALTRTGALVGTPAYMAPEQLAGRGADARADQFGFCVTLYEALTGERPYRGRTVGALRDAIAAGPVPTVRGVAGPVRRALARGLAADPAARYPSMTALLDDLTRERRRWRRGLLGAIAVGAIVVGAWRLGADRGAAAADPCGGGAAQLAPIWSDPPRAAIHAAFTATGRPYAEDAWRGVERRLDDYAAGWIALHRDVCTATAVRREQSPQLRDRRMACLAIRRAELEALTALLARADGPIVERAVGATAALSALRDCTDGLAATAPDPPHDRAAAAAIDRGLADAKMQWAAGQPAAALTAARAAAAAARTLADPPTLARALLGLGLAEIAIEPVAARATLRQAARAAEAAHLDAVKVDALIALVWMAGATGTDPAASLGDTYLVGRALDDAIELAADARASLARLGDDPAREAQLLDTLGGVYLGAGRLDDARTELTRALAIEARRAEPDDFALARVLGHLGDLAHDAGRLDEAVPHYTRAAALLTRSLGAEHPDLAALDHNLGLVLQELGQLADARARFEHTLAILHAALGPDHPSTIPSQRALGDTLVYLGDPAAGLVHLERARALSQRDEPDLLHSIGRAERDLGRLERALRIHTEAHALLIGAVGSDDAEVAVSHQHLGQVLAAAGRFADALDHFRAALRIDERAHGVDSVRLVIDLALVGGTERLLRRHRAAVRTLERAIAIGTAAPDAQPEALALARTELDLARRGLAGQKIE